MSSTNSPKNEYDTESDREEDEQSFILSSPPPCTPPSPSTRKNASYQGPVSPSEDFVYREETPTEESVVEYDAGKPEDVKSIELETAYRPVNKKSYRNWDSPVSWPSPAYAGPAYPSDCLTYFNYSDDEEQAKYKRSLDAPASPQAPEASEQEQECAPQKRRK